MLSLFKKKLPDCDTLFAKFLARGMTRRIGRRSHDLTCTKSLHTAGNRSILTEFQAAVENVR